MSTHRIRSQIIKDQEPYYGEVPVLQRVWATGKTLEECRRKLTEVIEDWIMVRINSINDTIEFALAIHYELEIFTFDKHFELISGVLLFKETELLEKED